MIKSQLLLLIMVVSLSQQNIADIPRTASGKPDLSGVYDTGTLTPTERPEWLGEIEYLYPVVASFLDWVSSVLLDWAMYSDSTRIDSAGGDGSAARAAGDIRQGHAVYARRDAPDAVEKSRPAGRLRPIREVGPEVISGTALPDITPAVARPFRLGVLSGTRLPYMLAESAPRRRAKPLPAGRIRPNKPVWP